MNEGGEKCNCNHWFVSGGKGSNSAAQLCGYRIGKLQGWTGKLQQIGGGRGNLSYWKRGEMYIIKRITQDMPYLAKWR